MSKDNKKIPQKIVEPLEPEYLEQLLQDKHLPPELLRDKHLPPELLREHHLHPELLREHHLHPELLDKLLRDKLRQQPK